MSKQVPDNEADNGSPGDLDPGLKIAVETEGLDGGRLERLGPQMSVEEELRQAANKTKEVV